MRGTLFTLLTTLLLALPALASAQVYKWKDANGTMHFSDSPPPHGVKYENVHTRMDADQARAPEPTSNGSNGNSGANQDNGNQRSQQLQKFCAQIESNLSLLRSNQPLQRVGNDGKSSQVDPQFRAQQLKQQQQRYDAYCKN